MTYSLIGHKPTESAGQKVVTQRLCKGQLVPASDLARVSNNGNHRVQLKKELSNLKDFPQI